MNPYLWYKSFHLIFMVAWFAGLFYIFRLFVYHVIHKNDEKICATFLTMEKKLLSVIMHPAMFLTFLFGILMIYKNPALMKQGWLHLKFLFVLLLIGYQAFARRVHTRFARRDFFLSERACRLINEVPTILLIVTVLLAVTKPL